MSPEKNPTGTLQVHDPPMRFSDGVCGPTADPVLARFEADLEWLGQEGVKVERLNLAQRPDACVNNPSVKQAIEQDGNQGLPLILAGGKIVSRGVYPNRDELASFVALAFTEPVSVYSPAVAELVAVGAAIAANREPCFKYHYAQAKQLGVFPREMAHAVAMAQAVKKAPARAMLGLAKRYLGCSVSPQDAGAAGEGTCCSPTTIDGSSKCC